MIGRQYQRAMGAQQSRSAGLEAAQDAIAQDETPQHPDPRHVPERLVDDGKKVTHLAQVVQVRQAFESNGLTNCPAGQVCAAAGPPTLASTAAPGGSDSQGKTRATTEPTNQGESFH